MAGGRTSESAFASAGAGGIIGTNELQQSIDKFSTAVNTLSSTVSGMSSTSGRGSGTQSSGPAQPTQAKGSQFSTGFFPKMITPSQIQGLNNSAGLGSPGGPGQRLTMNQMASMNSSYQGYTSLGGGAAGGAGGGGNVSTPNPMGATNANGGGSGSIMTGLSQIGGAIAGYGASQLGTQVAMNAYTTQAMLGVSPGMGNQYGRLNMQAFGNYNNNVNAIALNAQDAAAGQLTLNQISGSPFSAGALGSAASGATSAFGYINPSLGYQGAASMAAQLYSPQTSLAMRQMGYATPRASRGSNGGTMNSASVAQSILQRWYGKNSVNSNTLNASLANGATGYINLQALGMNPTQMTPYLQSYNKLFQEGYSTTAAQNLFNGAAKNQGQAQKQLAQALYGSSNPSDLQKIKNITAVQTGRSAGESGSFNQGLDDATSALLKFNQAMNVLLNGPLGKLAGFSAGVGSVSSLTGGSFLSGGIGGLLGMLGGGKLLGGLGSLFGGGGAAGGALGGIGGGTGGAGALGGLGAAGGIVGGSLLAGILGHVLGDKLSPAGSTGGVLSQMLTKMNMPGNFALGGLLGKLGSFSGVQSATNGIFNGVGSAFKGMTSLFGGALTAGGSSLTSSSSKSNTTSTSNVPGQVRTAVGDAEQQLGKPYVWGGDNPTTSFDCSGLVQWAYGQAGVQLPRTSQQQWSALKNKSVPMDQVREGDLIFMAGSDGTTAAPGHVAMMVSNKTLIQAPYTGANIQEIAYDPSQWSHAARPVGSTSASQSSTSASVSGNNSNTLAAGNSGSGGGLGLGVGAYGSVDELANIQGALLGGITAGGGSAGNGIGSSSTNTNGAAANPSSGNGKVNTSGGGAPGSNQALAKQMAASMYGWTGSQWSSGLLPLWTQESGFNNNAQNPTSTAYGIAQFLDSTWSGYGPKTSNPGLQIKYGLEYIKGRYGSPVGAEAHEKAYNWYGSGTGNAHPGFALVGERGPELVGLSGGQQIVSASKTRDVLKGQGAAAASAPWMSSGMAAMTYANQPQNSYTNAGAGVNLNMSPGAIVINAGSGNSSDISNAVEQGMMSVVKRLESNETMKAIAAGNKQG